MNPATGEVVGIYDEMTMADVADAVTACDLAQQAWRQLDFDQRALPLRRAAAVLRDRREELAGLMAREMGKLVREGRDEIDSCAWACEFFADSAGGFLAPELLEIDGRRVKLVAEPLGVVLAVMSWSSPFWQVLCFAAPALMAGNGALLKHAANTTGCALAVQEVMLQAGLPAHLFRTLVIPAEGVAPVLDNPLVRAVTLSGGRAAGSAVAMRAGERIKKSVLELGGCDAYVVLDDADVERAAEICIRSGMVNSGQSCRGAQRLVVCEEVVDEFEDRMVAGMRRLKMGDPFDEEAGLGPMASHELRDALHRQVQQSVAAGARCLLGGEVPDFEGAYYPPTVLTDVPRGCPACEEELLGPVVSVMPVADEEEAIAVANDSTFGLNACVFTRNQARGERIATDRLEAGSCFVNDFVRADPRLPFGGVKESGYGRELGRQGIRELVNLKLVWVA